MDFDNCCKTNLLSPMFQITKKDPNTFAVQPNVIKKSWTPKPAAACESDRSEEAFQSRGLIREYLLKTRVPEILKTSQNRRHSAVNTPSAMMTSEINFAYKHPLVAAEELLKTEGGETLAHSTRRKCFNDFGNSSNIIPEPAKLAKKILNNKRPHLIGKVTPDIAKTWEQLSKAMESSIESQSEDEDKQSFVLFLRKPFNFEESDENFVVNKMHNVGDNFFDSIENLQYDDENDESSGQGGEVLPENMDSLEMQRHFLVD